MMKPLCHGPAGSMSQTAGVLELEHEIRSTPTHELINHATVGVPRATSLMAAVRPRLRLTLWELQHRFGGAEVAA